MSVAAEDLIPGNKWIEANEIVTLCDILPYHSLSMVKLKVFGENSGFYNLILYKTNRRTLLKAPNP